MKKNKHLTTIGTLEKYVFDRRIFRVAFVILFALLILAFADNGFNFENQIYIECPNQEPLCNNPFYGLTGEDCPNKFLCSIETFKGGETWGEKPNNWFNTYTTLTVLIIFFAFIINHLTHNTRKQLKWLKNLK